MARAASVAPPSADAAEATRRNVALLVQLRWMAVGGQLLTILAVRFGLGVALPLATMLGALAALAALNVATVLTRGRWPASEGQLFAALLIDVACLTVQLYVSGGVGNPFVSLYLLQVVIAAVLLPGWPSWALAGLTTLLFGWLAWAAPAFALPPAYASALSPSYVAASWLNYALAATLLVWFVGRIVRILSARDARLAAYRQRMAEEEHIVRMGLLASGAAHELGTPLSSIAVMLGDWRGDAAVAARPDLIADVEAMRAEVGRCKAILDQVLLASGEVRGTTPRRTTLDTFLRGIVDGWRSTHDIAVTLEIEHVGARRIVGDAALAQTIANLLDNAGEAGARRIIVTAGHADGATTIAVRDDGRGFPADILATVGTPYRTSKARRGAGLGLFLASNVVRTLGGTLAASNPPGGGGLVVLTIADGTIDE